MKGRNRPALTPTKERVPRAAALGGRPEGGALWWGPGAKPLAFPPPACPRARLTGPPDASTSGDMLRRFDSLLDPTVLAPDTPPVAGLMRFYWHYICQARWLTAGCSSAAG
jgi:hypothetical protein